MSGKASCAGFIFAAVLCSVASGFTLRGLMGSQSNGQPSDFRGTLGNVVSGVAQAVAPNSCIGELMMTGYSNDLYNEDDYRYQPACEARGALNRLECFPGSSTVLTEHNGPTAMKDLQIGDRVLTVHPATFTEVYERVLFFLHRDPHRDDNDEWLQVKHEFGTLTLSKHHMLILSRGGGPLASMEADLVAKGDVLTILNRNVGIMNSTVVSVSHGTVDRGSQGIYAPVTDSGTLLVDGVLASSFSHLDMLGWLGVGSFQRTHDVLNALAWPLKVLAKSRVGCFAPAIDRVLHYGEHVYMHARATMFSLGVLWSK